MPRFHTLIFDLDGTLIDSAPAILASFESAFAQAGTEPVRPIEAAVIGPPLKETLELLSGSTDTATITRLTNAFTQAYDGGGLNATTAYEGVTTMLERLAGAGIELHIATNKRLHPTECILELFGWRPLFASVYALDMVSPRLPDKASMIARLLDTQAVDRQQAAYVGDRREDGEAANANSLAFFAATWGYGALGVDELEPGWMILPTPDPLRLQNG